MALSTRDGVQSKLRTHLLPPLGDLPVSQAFDMARSREVDVALVERGAATLTRMHVLLTLRSVAKFAVEAGILAQEPKFLPLPKRGRRVPSAPPAGDVSAVIDAARFPEHRLVFLLAAHGGLRKGEIRALRCGDVEIDNSRIVVRLSRFKTVTGSTKSGHEREVPLSSQLRAALLAARVQERPREEAAALSTMGKAWGTGGMYVALQTTLLRLKLPPTRLHALRSFFVTILLNGHVPVHVVRELVGHADLATTQGYAAIGAPDRGAAVGVLDRAYLGGRTVPAERPKRVRSMCRVSRITRRIRKLRSRVLSRAKGRGNSQETAPRAP
jgi:integrase